MSGFAVSSLDAWVGREQHDSDNISRKQVMLLATTLDLDPEVINDQDTLPPLWHWVFFTPLARHSELGPDGHPARGGFLPPVELPNRMWAGGRFVFHQPLYLDENITRRSRISRCERKSGRNGDLVFVTVHHSIHGKNGLAVEEEHDIVYRNPTPKDAPLAGERVLETPDFRTRISPDPVLLFRYSALTFNSHRIHYDQPYVTQEEGYPGLVVHGPLTATLLLEAFRKTFPANTIERYAFRAVGPLFDNQDFDVCGRVTEPGQATLWTDCDGRLTMRAEVSFRT